jgi:excinuclease ABC subunit C
LPSQPGVYWFLDEKNNVLYVGKAKNLKNRLASYTRTAALTSRIKEMTLTAQQLKFQVLESELEALLVEAELIRLHQPPYNVLLKDDKTPLYIHITHEAFPRVLTARKKEIDTQKITKGITLGPFPSGYKVKEVLTIARSIFPWCNQRGDNPIGDKPCFYHHLDLCPGACVGKITAEDYATTIKELLLFLRGEKKAVVRNLITMMKDAAEVQQFELAQQLKQKVALITTVTQQQYRLKPDFSLPRLRDSVTHEGLLHLQKLLSQHGLAPRELSLNRIEGYDVSNTQGTNAAVAMVVFEEGRAETSEYRLFNIRTLNTPNDYHMMKEAILRRQNHPEWGQPDLLLIDGGRGQLRAARSVWHWSCPVISIAKHPDRIIIPTNNLTEKPTYAIYTFPEGHPVLSLIQQIRDEAHRFSKKQHARRHLRQLLK